MLPVFLAVYIGVSSKVRKIFFLRVIFSKFPKKISILRFLTDFHMHPMSPFWQKWFALSTTCASSLSVSRSNRYAPLYLSHLSRLLSAIHTTHMLWCTHNIHNLHMYTHTYIHTWHAHIHTHICTYHEHVHTHTLYIHMYRHTQYIHTT